MSIGRIYLFANLRRKSTAHRAARLAGALLLTSVVLAPLPGAAEPASPHRPLTIAAAQRQIAVLQHEAEIASERMNALRVRLQAARHHLHGLQTEVARQRARVGALRADIVGSAVTDFQSGVGLSITTSFFMAKDSRAFLANLTNKAVAANQEAAVMARLRQQQLALAAREQQAQRQLGAIANDKAALAKHQAVLDKKTEQAHQVLAQLRKRQRERLARRQARQEQQAAVAASRDIQRVATDPPAPATSSAPDTPAPVSAVPASGAAQTAVSYALAQVGDPYVYGAAGPDAFDCSGLTMSAWAAAGVSIPHASSMQPGAGTPVSQSALMPGDLVFYYSPISHVALYIGNGQVVDAPHPGSSVEVVPLSSMPVTMAVRIG